ncbi:hypothetical protein [Fibrella forsythiae]|uniref:DUF4397 domain-containing protein n=1 Tax=Fibrella forsythiae TaxID=2817061 RepID=A0ABS3JCR8_9BACT|nr:hypothetical protein [Fibrella forsythiae]MBO0947233.1 hypothetical protein [Fibrella forsythiae]
MRTYLFLLCMLAGLTSFAQPVQPKAVRLYRVNDQVVIADSLGAAPTSYPTSQVSIRSFRNVIEVAVGSASVYYRPDQLLNAAGVAYGNTVTSAINTYLATIPSTGSSTVSTSTTATFGTVQPLIVDYTTSATITTTSVIDLLIENVGTGTASMTYAGVTYSLATGDQRRFLARTDPTSGKLTPYPSITVNGTASTVRVVKILQQ